MFNNTSIPMYDQTAVQPMRDELKAVGFDELLTSEDVDKAILRDDDKTVLVVINSVCGCAAGSARPGVSLALQNDLIPDVLTTAFAGQEKEAVARVRELLVGQAPSSPSMAIFQKGEPVFFLPRHFIEGRSAEQIAGLLKQVFTEHCKGTGPSISPEDFDKVQHYRSCGKTIPLNEIGTNRQADA